MPRPISIVLPEPLLPPLAPLWGPLEAPLVHHLSFAYRFLLASCLQTSPLKSSLHNTAKEILLDKQPWGHVPHVKATTHCRHSKSNLWLVLLTSQPACPPFLSVSLAISYSGSSYSNTADPCPKERQLCFFPPWTFCVFSYVWNSAWRFCKPSLWRSLP